MDRWTCNAGEDGGAETQESPMDVPRQATRLIAASCGPS
jgi:hypothetical protein